MMPQNGTKVIDAQKTEISISADGDFGETKKTETPSKKTESWQVEVYVYQF